MPKRFYAILALILAALACNWADIMPLAAPVIEPSPLPTFAIPTITPSPTVTPLPTLTSTPDAPIAWPSPLGVNCRYGPGEEWEVVSQIPADTTFPIKGRTVDATWWYIQDPFQADLLCWVDRDVVETAGNINNIPLAEEPEASVAEATVDAAISFTACGGSNEVKLNGSVTTNGPAKVTYHWELSGDAQYTSAETTIEVDESGEHKLATEIYSADCGSYTAVLTVTDPDELSSEKIFKVQAP